MTQDRLEGPSFGERLAGRAREHALSELIERTFPMDASAIARGRALVSSRSVSGDTIQRPAGPRLPIHRVIAGATVMAVAFALVLVAVVGGGLLQPAGRVGSTSPVPSISTALTMARSSSDLDAVLAAVQTGDSAALVTVVEAYQSDLTGVAAAITEPGADLDAIRTQLKVEKVELARAAQLGSPAARAQMAAVQAKLDRILATLGNGPIPGQPSQGNGGANGGGNGAPGNKPSSPPGAGNGGGGNGGGNGGSGPGGNGGGNGAGNGNGTGGNGKGHPKTK